MATRTFKEGDVVRLISGGPKMTIRKVDEGGATCCWMKDGGYDSAWFDFRVLTTVKPVVVS